MKQSIHIFISFLEDGLKTFLIIALCLIGVKEVIVSVDQVVGNSMVPNFKSSQHFVVNKIVYYFRSPARGDVVQAIEPQHKSFVIKRVIGIPGDVLFTKNGVLYRGSANNPLSFADAQRVFEPYLPESFITDVRGSTAQTMFIVPPNHYFLIGDNRSHSTDSRVYGPVSRISITGFVQGL